VLAESYFDETNTHNSAERLCVGGYVFHKESAERQAIPCACCGSAKLHKLGEDVTTRRDEGCISEGLHASAQLQHFP